MDAAGPGRDAPTVASLHRYPVKSLLGETVSHLSFDERGAVGDRRWSVRTREGKIGSGKSTRRFAALPHLQQVRARHAEAGVVVTLPDGTEHALDSVSVRELLSRVAGQPVTVAEESDVSHFDDGPVSLLARASVDAVTEHRGERVDAARFRPNVVVDGLAAFAEESWIGRRLRIGTAVLSVQLASPRCVMVDAATADLPPQPGNLLAVGRLNQARLGVIACVVHPGVVRVGDPISVEPRLERPAP